MTAKNNSKEIMYDIVILYREPSHELRFGSRKEPFRTYYQLKAINREEAEKKALEKFRFQEKNSSVSWRRFIESLEINEQK